MADGDLYLSDSPNVDTGLVEQDGQLHRSVLTAVPEGTLSLSDSANVSTGYVTDANGKKHKVNLVSEVEGTLELSDNPSSDTGYVTDNDGKKHKVKLTATLHGGGSAPVIEELNVTPSTSAQTITAPTGTDGYSPVNVSAVTSSIDANIVAGNIKKDVSILGVTGSYEGVAPSGTKQITSNGTHDVAGYANADVQVPTTAPAYYIEKIIDSNNRLLTGHTLIDLTGVTDIGAYALYCAYYSNGSNAISNVEWTSLTTISGASACNGAFSTSKVQSVNLSSLTTISGANACNQMFSACSKLTTINLSSLTTVSGVAACGSMFSACSNLTTADLPLLTNLTGMMACMSMFANCSKLVSVNLPSLQTLTGQQCLQAMFQNCTALTTLSFPALTSASFGNKTNQFNQMLSGVTGCTVHFPSNLQSVIGSWSDVTAGFSGTNTTVLFDLTATS